MLVVGTLERAQWPELDDEEFAGEVRERLAQVGLELVGAGGRWLARPVTALQPEEGFDPIFHLNSIQLAVVAALYLHLRYVPRQAGALDAQHEPSIEIDELHRAFPGHSQGFIDRIVLGSLVKAGFVRRFDKRLYAGPYLAAINEIEADERAQAALSDFQLRRYLQRRARELEAGDAAG
jgi:hypothetical protein